MNVLLVSQCSKRALKETRRILDQFAERRGDRTWQTPITQAGLDTLRKLLRKTARKNTAVACHWIRGHDQSDLLWIVGNAGRFNAEGATPTNRTTRNILRSGDENDWHTAQDIRLLAQLAALLHDLGKASVAFQQRLRGERQERNLYRHEWVSLRLFLAFVGADDDAAWLTRLANAEHHDAQVWIGPDRYLRDGLDRDIESFPFRHLTSRAPLAAAMGWLVVTHHRLPAIPVEDKHGMQAYLGKRAGRFEQGWLEQPLASVAHDWNEIRPAVDAGTAAPYWELAGELPVTAAAWRTRAARIAGALLKRRERNVKDYLANPYVMHLARLSLMLADHHYSSLGQDRTGCPAAGRQQFLQTGQTIFANTLGPAQMNQSLLEHLLGVGHTAGLIAHALPGFEQHLPRIANHRGLRKRSKNPRFRWQDKAFDAASSMREAARARGAFIVNMASTGCGKTLANVRILYALADPQIGVRASYALGLRTLTLQTGHSYRNQLKLGEDELAVLVGGAASRDLFDYYQKQAEATGSASSRPLLDEDSHVLFEGNTTDHPLLSRALADPKIRKLLSAPMLVCTVDHLAPATEALRAGRQIAPMLRLMSADLILDELDDYGLDDLPALTRLMHWAGLLGSRVVLSSATLPPSLVQGMFLAYRAGRKLYRQNRGPPGTAHLDAAIPCLWVDEFGVKTAACGDDRTFTDAHDAFIAGRVAKLESADPLRRAELLPLAITSTQPEAIRNSFARHVRDACLRLHAAHADTDPDTGKQVSFGLVRMANIEPIFDVARALLAFDPPDDTQIHWRVYHARFPLALRSAIEQMLDACFDRRTPDDVWRQLSVRHALDVPNSARNHLFVVLASPVCEVGRDWDADWAVVEPSSMRSIIQLAGRVQRHRRKPCCEANMLVFDTNLKHFEQVDAHKPVFIRPGFEKLTEDERFLLSSHRLDTLLRESEYATVDAVPRISRRPVAERMPRERLTDLEQARMEAAMRPRPTVAAPSSGRRGRASVPPPGLERDQAAPAWQFPQAALTGVLQQQQPFRADSARHTTLAFLPDDEEDTFAWHRVEDDPDRRYQKLYISASGSVRKLELPSTSGIDCWGNFDLAQLITVQAEAHDMPLSVAAKKYATVDVRENDQGWNWHPQLGFGRRK